MSDRAGQVNHFVLGGRRSVGGRGSVRAVAAHIQRLGRSLPPFPAAPYGDSLMLRCMKILLAVLAAASLLGATQSESGGGLDYQKRLHDLPDKSPLRPAGAAY